MHPRKPIQAILIAVALQLAGGQALAGHYAENTPGQRFFIDAQRSYQAGRYTTALAQFRSAARWADKVAQFNLGVMHYQGQGTEPDPARAWAWFALAAERKYPQMVNMADQVWSELNAEQRMRARRILEEELEPHLGDRVAIERTARHMERERRQVTGSRAGTVGFLTVLRPDGRSEDGSRFYDEEKWDFHQVMARESKIFDAVARGRVELREVDSDEDQDSP